MADKPPALDFQSLVAAIRQVDEHLAAQAGKAVNVCLTLRNWAIGFYILEYEQRGADRAEYGGQLLERLAERLRQQGMPRVEARELRRYRQFYSAYPQIRESLTPELHKLLPYNLLTGPSEIWESPPPGLAIGGANILTKLFFTHLAELTALDDPLILLCAQKNDTLAEYALAGMDNRLFVSKYQLELQSRETMSRFLEEKMREVTQDA